MSALGKADIWRRSAPSLLISSANSRSTACAIAPQFRGDAGYCRSTFRPTIRRCGVGPVSGWSSSRWSRFGLPPSISLYGSRYRCFICCPAGNRKRSSRDSRTRAQIQRRAEIKRVVPCPFIPRRNLERFVGDLAGENLVCLVKFVPGIAHGIAPQVSRQPTSSNSTQLVERQRGPQILQSQRNRVEFVTFRHCLSALPPRADVRVACPTGP